MTAKTDPSVSLDLVLLGKLLIYLTNLLKGHS
jgi:hypothetical protein